MVIKRADFEVDGLERTDGALDVTEAHVGVDGTGIGFSRDCRRSQHSENSEGGSDDDGDA
jgi:hypothetical protein